MNSRIIIWDVDGVLIDVSNSYRKTIIETVQYYFSNLLGINLREYLITIKDTQKFKNASGFNDDFDLTYSIILCYLTKLLEGVDGKALDRKICKNYDHVALNIDQMLIRLNSLGRLISGNELELDIDEITRGIRENGGGMEGAEKTLRDKFGNNLEIAKKFWFPRLIKRIFEEIYLGGELFREKYDEDARFINSDGLIMNERPLVTLRTLLEIRRRYYFGIVTGRERFETEFSLKMSGIDRIFDKETIITSTNIREKKPSAEPLLECRRRICRKYGLGKSSIVIYVGDSVDDLISAKNANFYFAGVVGAISDDEERNKLREILHDMHADIIVDDILELSIYV